MSSTSSPSDTPAAVSPDVSVSHEKPSPGTLERVKKNLERLERLSDLLGSDETYAVAPLDYELPADFKVSIVVPVYNERQSIGLLLARVDALPLPKEIIVVDDGSIDGTRQLLQALEPMADVRVVLKQRNEGKGSALRLGFRLATGDVVVVQDADLEYDPRDIPSLLRPIVQGEADVVYGSRFCGDEQQDSSFVHRLGNRLLTCASNLFTGLKLTDMETCYKVFRRSVLEGIEIQQDRFGFEPEITAKIARRQLRLTELPIRYERRSYAEGKKIGIRDGFHAVYCIIRYGLRD